MNNINQALQQAKLQLANSQSAKLDADILLAAALHCERSFLYAHTEFELSETVQLQFNEWLNRRSQGEAIAHIMGHREFWSLDFKVNAQTLIPRPETELLVAKALELFSAEEDIQLLDLGTGSGAIAIAIGSERPNWTVTAVDNSPEALKVAEYNKECHGANNVKIINSDWFSALQNCQYHIIVSNPPYIADDDPDIDDSVWRYEPAEALFAADQGLGAIKKIINQAPLYLLPGGAIILEHGCQQAQAVCQLLTENGYQQCSNYKDLAGLPRCTTALYL